MITFFNKLGNSWIAKGIFFLLGVSMMAFWGLGGISNTSTSDNAALQVGSYKISLQELNHSFEQERNKISRISGGYITPKRALQMGLLNQVIQQLALRELNALIQEEMGLIASDDAVRRYIEKNPVFMDSLGKFDVNLFYTYLDQLNLSQPEFAKKMRTELAIQHLNRTLMLAVPRDPSLMQHAALVQKEKRQVEALFLTPKDMKVSTPSSQELKDYYDAYMEEFIIPEYRTLRLVSIKSSDFQNDYNLMLSSSQKMEDLLGAGKTLKEVVTEMKLNPGQIFVVDFNGLDKQGKAQAQLKSFLQEAFTLEEGEATSLMDVEDGFMVVGVEKITPPGHKDFASAKEDVVNLWRREQQKELMEKKIKDIVASLQQGKGWGNYVPKNDTISRTESKLLPMEFLPALMQQKMGYENAQVFPTKDGIWVAYVKRTIPFKDALTEKEKQEAVQGWAVDLTEAFQQAYLQKYPIKVHENIIQKAFSIYDKQED
ncbi:MAG: peptidylprolyl isomerase [Alphaproteobacteria bacterium]|nr:peptidylprolyl isomerase [Alphaproteobacteria bacterium]